MIFRQGDGAGVHINIGIFFCDFTKVKMPVYQDIAALQKRRRLWGEYVAVGDEYRPMS